MSFLNSGTGTRRDPYKIYTEDDLFAWGNFSRLSEENVFYEMMNDITLTNNWNPPSTFSGIFNARGHSINNLTIQNSTTRAGFVQYLFRGLIINLTLNNTSIRNTNTTTGGVGTIAGYAFQGAVKNCIINESRLDISGSARRIGGIFGWSRSDSLIENTAIRGTLRIIGGNQEVGGFVGEARDTIVKQSTFSGRPWISSGSVPSVNTFRNFLYSGAPSTVVISNCILHYTNTESWIPSTPTNVTGAETRIILSGTDKSLYETGTISWEFGEDKYWNMIDGQPPYPTGLGTNINPISLSNLSDVIDISNGTESDWKHYKLTNDIELPYRDSRFPLPRRDNIVLDGDGFSFTDLNLSYSETSQQGWGIYRIINNFHVENLRMKGFDFQTYSKTGAFAGESMGDVRFDNCLVDDCRINIYASITASTSQWREIGGFIGNAIDPIVFENCAFIRTTANNAVSGTHATGGFVGTASDSIVRNSIFIGMIRAQYTGHSFIGSGTTTFNNNIVENSYARHLNYFQSTDTQGTHLSNQEDFANPANMPELDFDNVWGYANDFNGGALPIQRVFNKLSAVIEQKIIQSYTKVMNTDVSHLSKRVREKVVALFSRKKANSVTKNKKKNKTSVNFMKNVLHDLNMNIIRRSIAKVESFTNKMKSDIIISVIRRSIVKIESFTQQMHSHTTALKIRRTLRRTMSYSKNIFSNIRILSNLNKIGNAVIISSVGRIASNVKKEAKLTLRVKSYIKKMTFNVNLIFPVDAMRRVYAYVLARFNHTNAIQRENKTKTSTNKHKTIINKKDNGGEGGWL